MVIKKITVTAEPFDAEIIAGRLWLLDLDGLLEEEDSIVIFKNDSAKFDSNDIENMLRELVDEKLLRNFSISITELEDRNWNREWERSVGIIHATEKITVKPSFKEYTAGEGEILLTIDPKMSFGTGEHETTRLMLGFLENQINSSDNVLDLGCGTGILSIAALKLGASSVTAVDNDETSIINAKENFELNGLSAGFDLIKGEISDLDKNNFNLILANISRNVLVEISSLLANKLLSGGKLILSGFLIQDERGVLNSFTAKGFRLIDKKVMNEWTGLVFERL